MKQEQEIYYVEINDVGDLLEGISKVAVVDKPAMLSKWMAFEEQKKQLNFKIQDEEKRVVSGVLIVADMPIERLDDFGNPYYVVFKKETIYQLAQKYFREKKTDLFKATHEQGADVKGVYVFESYITDFKRGKLNPKGYESMPEGTWFVDAKIDNPDVWAKVKDGTFNGFSIEIFSTLKRGTSLTDKEIEATISAIVEGSN